jgi:hypothetical protein
LSFRCRRIEERVGEEARSLGNFQTFSGELVGREACTFEDVYVL